MEGENPDLTQLGSEGSEELEGAVGGSPGVDTSSNLCPSAVLNQQDAPHQATGPLAHSSPVKQADNAFRTRSERVGEVRLGNLEASIQTLRTAQQTFEATINSQSQQLAQILSVCPILRCP